MQPWQVMIAVLAGLLALGITAGAVSYLRPARLPNGRSVAEITRRIHAEDGEPRARGSVAQPGVWPVGWPHEAPETPFTVAQAHVVMQQHRRCAAERCPRKRAAFRVLVAAGHAVPDSRADRYLHDD
jgi:hypothetical protein